MVKHHRAMLKSQKLKRLA